MLYGWEALCGCDQDFSAHWPQDIGTHSFIPVLVPPSLSSPRSTQVSLCPLYPTTKTLQLALRRCTPLAQKHRFPHPEAPDTTWAHLPRSLCSVAASALVSRCRWSPPRGLLPFCLVPSPSIYLLSKTKTLAFLKSIVTVKKKKSIRNSNDFLLSFFG